MSSPRQNVNGPRLARRFVAGLALVAYLISSAGFLPLPVLPNKRKPGIPFPCQDHPCGCSCAEDCWRHCCCFSAAERWEWAAANEVEPPDYAEKPAAAGWSTARLRDQTNQPATCERAKHASCCETHASRDDRDHQHSASEPAAPARPLSIFTAARCQDLSAAWVGVGAVLPILPGPGTPLDRAPIERLSYPDSSPILVSLVPPDPPPRLA
jgi:hypothetical protein